MKKQAQANARDAEIAATNQEAANSGPLDAAAGSQLYVASGVSQGALAAEGSIIPAKTNPPGEGSSDTGLAADMTAANEAALLGGLSEAVKKDMLSRPAGDLSSERSMQAAIKGFREAFAIKYEHLLTGMANSTAEALRCLADAEIHLADHIAQQDTPKVGD